MGPTNREFLWIQRAESTCYAKRVSSPDGSARLEDFRYKCRFIAVKPRLIHARCAAGVWPTSIILPVAQLNRESLANGVAVPATEYLGSRRRVSTEIDSSAVVEYCVCSGIRGSGTWTSALGSGQVVLASIGLPA